jgi:hypothetical protein
VVDSDLVDEMKAAGETCKRWRAAHAAPPIAAPAQVPTPAATVRDTESGVEVIEGSRDETRADEEKETASVSVRRGKKVSNRWDLRDRGLTMGQRQRLNSSDEDGDPEGSGDGGDEGDEDNEEPCTRCAKGDWICIGKAERACERYAELKAKCSRSIGRGKKVRQGESPCSERGSLLTNPF